MLSIVPKALPPDTPVTRSRKRLAVTRVEHTAQCPRCSGREMIQTRMGVVIVNGKPQGGVSALICAACHRNGERVEVT